MSFQVVQKYEQGEIRVSASRLYQLSRLLAAPVEFFFDGLEAEGSTGDAGALQRNEMELVRAFRIISSSEVQHRLLQLVRGMADQHDAGVTDAAQRGEPRK